jgi:hypothetical protein
MSRSARPAPDLPERRADWELFPELDRAWPADGFGPIAVLAAQLRDPRELAAGSLVFVHERPRRARGLGGLLALGKSRGRAHAAVRCTALLVRGYADIGAADDPRSGERLVWGFVIAASHATASDVKASDVTASGQSS